MMMSGKIEMRIQSVNNTRNKTIMPFLLNCKQFLEREIAARI